MIPRPYGTAVNQMQAAIAALVIVAATVAALLDKVSGDALIALLSAIVGAVLGASATAMGANGVATKMEEATREAVRQAGEHPDEPRE